METFKVVGRFKKEDLQKSWSRGKEGTQAKKRIYVSKSDYEKHSGDLIKRWIKSYDIEVYKLIDGIWVLSERITI